MNHKKTKTKAKLLEKYFIVLGNGLCNDVL